MVNQKRLAEIGFKMSQQVAKIGQAYMIFIETGEPPQGLRELFLDVEALAKAAAAELEKIQLDSQATPGRC